MSHSYASEYPADATVDPSIVAFFESFYKTSDIPGYDENYLAYFVPDATLKLASITTKGHQQITLLRQGSWRGVHSWIHTINKIFPFGSSGATEFMLYGSVDITRDSGTSPKDWAAHAVLVSVDGQWKLQFYQVYLDSDKE